MKLFLNLVLALILLNAAEASSPKVITYKTQRDFVKGEPKGVSINHRGEILLASSIEEQFSSDLAFVWSVVTDSDGNLYAAGGNGGQVFKIAPDKSSELFFEAPEVQIYALATDGKKHLFVATSPDGKVYRIPFGEKIKAEVAGFFDPQETYIWSLALDHRGYLYVATGEKGRIYKIDPTGKSTLFYESEDTHIRTMLLDRSGNLYAGTSDNAMILKIDSEGKAFVLYDSPLVEITDLHLTPNGVLYAAATGEARTTPQQRGRSTGGEESEGDDDDDDLRTLELSAQQLVMSRASGSSPQNDILYRIEPDGMAVSLWTEQSERIHAISQFGSGDLLLGTGSNGRLYSMNSAGEYTLVTEFDEMEITVVTRDASDRLLIGTSNAGKVYQLNEKLGRSGDYLSEVVDAEVTSQWGTLSWDANVPTNTSIRFRTRSGNTEKPDKTWSDWSEEYTLASGQNIASPPARFLQIKATFTAARNAPSPVLKHFTFSYLQKNVAPRIKEITLHSPGEYFPESANNVSSNSHMGNGNGSSQNQSLGRKTEKPGYRSVSWDTEDTNGDALMFDVFYRGEEEETWKILVEDFSGPVYSWDSQLFPDGRFLIKVVASDKPANPPAYALQTEKISQPFVIDNSGPAVRDISIQSGDGGATIRFVVEDMWNIVSSVEYGVNAEKWVLVYPVDGICDSKREEFEVKIDSGIKGTNNIVIKAKDALENIGFGTERFKL